MTASFYLEGEVWFHKTSLAPPRCIEVPVPSEESERVRGVDFAYFYDFFCFSFYY